jgi:autophagy-related protein 5
MKLYLPTAATASTSEETPIGSVRVVQSLVPALISSSTRYHIVPCSTYANRYVGQPQTMGTALNEMLPTIFPSRRRFLLAEPVLHGATVPVTANVEELLKFASYADGWLHVVIVIIN